MTFGEILQQLVTLTQTIRHDAQLSPEERAALVLVGYERFDQLMKDRTLHPILVQED